ncbi:hypothetical protein Pmani_028000 [Petrolisthes manimaculis]|uniref:DUF4789 domain-containing protein n=1 Tax=Petrolisthes manimaculis TaxID=1843537 RepID=A0AAE1P095_9EUCA|nr:hypothetical protein Pmani_028000 [Petrolisthes manimaculis]
MGKVAFTLLVLGGLTHLLHCEMTMSKTSHLIKRQSPVPLMNPPIPTSIGHYLGGDQQLDQCERDETLVLGGCHRVLTQGPCKLEEQVLLDPATKKGFCAARLCSPDRIFVFSDQQCHDPMNTALCPPGRQLYQSAYGTPICQCPDGTYEGDDDLDDDVCDPLLGRTLSCPPNQVLWFRDFRMPPECLPDPCGGENLNRGPNDLPFVPSSIDGRCHQLGQSKGVCPAQTWYSLALDALKGICTTLEEAGYQIFDEETLAAFNKLYGPPIARESTMPLPTPPSQTTPSLSPQSPQRPVSQQSPTLQSPQSKIPLQSPVSSLSPQSPSLQPPGSAISGSTQGRQDISSGQGFTGQPGSATPGQRFSGQSGTASIDQSFTGQPGTFTPGQSFAGRPGSSTGSQGFAGRPGSSTGGQGFAGRPGGSTAGQGFAGHPGSSTVGQNFGGTFSPGQVRVSSSGQSFSGQTGASPGKPALSPTRQPFSGQTTISSNNQVGGFTTTQKFSGHSGVSSSGHTTMFATSSGFTGQRGASTAGQRFSGQQGFSSGGQVSSGHQSISTTGQRSGHTDMSSTGRRFSSQVTVGQHVDSPNATFRSRMPPQASSFLSPRLPQMPTMHGRPHMGQPSGGFVPQGFNQGGYFFSHEMMSFERFGPPHMQMRHPNMARGRSFTASAPSQTNVGTPSRPSSHHTATKSKPEADLEVREGHLLTAVTGLSDLGKAGTQDLSYLHKPRDHQLHSFYNGVRTIMSGVLNGSGHHRGRRSPLPHATPGNVFETRLVGCRAGAVRDINAKCRSTILPARAPVKRSTRVVPPVPPRPGCPTGQVYNLRRMCSPRNDANNSVNSFNLGK